MNTIEVMKLHIDRRANYINANSTGNLVLHWYEGGVMCKLEDVDRIPVDNLTQNKPLTKELT